MTVQNPPVWITGGTYTPELDRRLIEALFGGKPGVLTAGALVVTQTGVASMNLDVAGGMVLVDGTEATYQGQYLCENRGTAQVTVTAAHASNPRIDLVVARVKDSAYSGALNEWVLEVKAGTAAAVPAEPTPDANSFVLAKVTVRSIASGGGTILTSDIEDRRIQSGKGLATANGGTIVTTSAQRPTAGLYEGMRVYETDTNRDMIHNGSAWVGAGSAVTNIPLYYNPGLTNGTATGYNGWANSGTIMVAPYPLTMVVRAYLQFGFSSTDHHVVFTVNELTGVNITKGLYGTGGTNEARFDLKAGMYQGATIVGALDYATGGNVGFQLAYKVDSGNVYAFGVVEVVLYPKAS